ncbi:Hypothetical protein R9X50_00509200 [Acrodontium crateriforme]|uniref:Acid phosphatase n=1 Tax=Acrodontium crateriforme TaxID=150365 RepID=A0AAQ3RAM8_9PEZI|nr:Hypothetical protein R9X50_00509200 [Acrodontium crateriforme]
MVKTLLISAFAALAAAQANKYTATAPSDVYAAQATALTSHPTSHVKGKVFDRFITIWLENTDFDKAQGDINLAWLATKGISLNNYFAVTHPSQPNYVAAIGGDNFGMDNDAFSQIDANVSTVIDLLEDRGISWGTYQEDMPYSGFEGNWINQQTKKNDYVRKHNPPINYNANTDSRRLSYQKNLTMFNIDLKQKTLPQWIFITPNMTSDGHDTSVTTAGTWTRNFLEPLLDNEYFMKNTLILVTFDENHTYGAANRVFSILLGGAVPKNKVGCSDTNFYNHYSEIATVEANWGLHTLGRWDVGANVFDMVAKHTGDIYRPNNDATGASPSRFYNSSFAGPFNEDFETAPYPVPNIFLFSQRTFRTVLPKVIETWGLRWIGGWGKSLSNPLSYYRDTVVIPDGQHPPQGYAVNTVDN